MIWQNWSKSKVRDYVSTIHFCDYFTYEISAARTESWMELTWAELG